jgi:hypothetical protein
MAGFSLPKYGGSGTLIPKLPTGGFGGGVPATRERPIPAPGTQQAGGGGGGTWGEYGTYNRYDPTTGNTYLEANRPPVNPAIEEEIRQQSAMRQAGDWNRSTAMRTAQDASAMGQSLGMNWSVGPDGSVSFSGGGGGGGSNTSERAHLLRMLEEALKGGAPPITHGGSGTDSSAAFARAKDRASQSGRSALNALYDIGAASGRTGSPLEAGMASDVSQAGIGQLADFDREQAIYDATRRGQISDLIYQGGITQRGQDLSRQQQIIQALLAAYGQRF